MFFLAAAAIVLNAADDPVRWQTAILGPIDKPVSALQRSDRRLVLKTLEEELRGDIANETGALATLSGDLRFKRVDLDGDGVPELVLQGMGPTWCGATGNCAFWILRKFGGGFVEIFDSGPGQSIFLQPTRSKGWKDFVLSTHDTATRSIRDFYRFNGTRYERSSCYAFEWDEKQPRSQVPSITPCN